MTTTQSPQTPIESLEQRLREAATVLDEPFHHDAIAVTLLEAADALRRLEQEQFNGDHWFAEAQKQAQRAEAAEQKVRDLEQEQGTR